MYILIRQTITVACYWADPSSRQEGRPTTNKRNSLDHTQNLVMSPKEAKC